ncbi:MAG: substrate-binding domain-containing protein [Bacteroidia bacterium]
MESIKILKKMNGTGKFPALLVLLSFFSCNRSNFTADLSDTPTSGNLKISVDASYQPLMDSEVNTFTSLYSLARIEVAYKPEADVINDLLNDSVKVAIANKKLSDEQEKYLNSRKCFPRTTKIAVDAIAFLVNKENPDTLLLLSQLKEILTGNISTWNKLNAKNKLDSIRIVFDNNSSGNTRFLKDKFLGDKNFPPNCYAVKTNPEVISYVQDHKNALGIIGVNWISDSDDEAANNFRKNIKVAALKNDTSSQNQEYYQPFQAYIALNQYPLTRDVYLINRESRHGLGTGFASFVAGDKGQRIVRLAGLLPATMPIRIVKVE